MKVVLLFNGGVDSVAAALTLKQQGHQVVLLHLFSPFFGGPNNARVKTLAKSLSLPLIITDSSAQSLFAVQSNQKPFGKFANPCVDCRAAMLRIAERVRQQLGFDRVATGDVLDQHVESQSLQALKASEKMAQIQSVLRPLSDGLISAKSGGLKMRGQRHSDQEQVMKQSKVCTVLPMLGCKLLNDMFSKKILILKQDNVLQEQFQWLIVLIKMGKFFRLSQRKYVICLKKHECSTEIHQSLCVIRSDPALEQKTAAVVVNLSLIETEKLLVPPIFEIQQDIEDIVNGQSQILCTKQNAQNYGSEPDQLLEAFAAQVYGYYSRLEEGRIGEKVVRCKAGPETEALLQQKGVV